MIQRSKHNGRVYLCKCKSGGKQRTAEKKGTTYEVILPRPLRDIQHDEDGAEERGVADDVK